MNDTGISRSIDELGRIIIPIEIRQQFNINEKDKLRIYTNENTIILKKES
jgi:transcriptional pleiotropic regulator of transition state genes